jgi:2-oxoglutarate ferredoxin oxidoreductase subunit gamma
MNGPSFDKFIGTVKKGGKVIIDSSLVDRTSARDDIEVFPVPATKLSNEEHLEGIANMILLGKVIRETNLAGMETVEKSIRKCVPARKEHLIEHNLRAIKLGMSL